MKRIIILLSALALLFSFLACEKEANASDFLSDEDLETLLGVEITENDNDLGILEEPIFIAEIDGEAYVAISQIAFLEAEGLIIIFFNEEGNELRFVIDNPSTSTFTGGRNSVDKFVAQYTVGDQDAVFSTSPTSTSDLPGVLMLIFTGDIATSESFSFTAANVETGEEIQALDGRFTEVLVVDRQ